MKRYLIAFVAVIAVLVIFTFYPGLKREKALATLNSTPWIAKQHVDSKVLDQDMHIIPVPFGGFVVTDEGAWYITFWGRVVG